MAPLPRDNSMGEQISLNQGLELLKEKVDRLTRAIRNLEEIADDHDNRISINHD